eukprot:TRINITY_DN2344_c0_g1_i1.p1 TRINITY_DN2344_c0_g1~~TRINITY_DN2344_c0_g1_i1.p1  ORF type:complete len:128 (-),score=34.12 TRINITY_DN2344_c0_g1_i1:181-564(-)
MNVTPLSPVSGKIARSRKQQSIVDQVRILRLVRKYTNHTNALSADLVNGIVIVDLMNTCLDAQIKDSGQTSRFVVMERWKKIRDYWNKMNHRCVDWDFSQTAQGNYSASFLAFLEELANVIEEHQKN